MLISREERKRKQRQRAKKSRSQLLGPVAQGGQGRAPMQRGYTKSSEMIGPPQFRQPDIGKSITEAGLAFKGGKGVKDWAEGGYKMPSGSGMLGSIKQSLSDMPIANIDKLPSEMGSFFQNLQANPSNALEQANRWTGGLFGKPSPMTANPGTFGHTGGMGQFGQSEFARQAAEMATPEMQMFKRATDLVPAGGGAGARFGTQAGPVGGFTAMQYPTIGAGSSLTAGTAGSNLLGAGNSAFGGSQAASNLASNLTSTASGVAGAQAGTAASAAKGAEAAKAAKAAQKGSEAGAKTAAQTGSSTFSKSLPYIGIALDLGMGGNTPITGDPYGDAAVRAAAAAATSGWSEVGYAAGSLFDWW